jgi:hypothetical protein
MCSSQNQNFDMRCNYNDLKNILNYNISIVLVINISTTIPIAMNLIIFLNIPTTIAIVI